MARLLAVRAQPNRTVKRPTIELTGYGPALCYEECSGRWFRSDWDRVRDQLVRMQNFVADHLGLHGDLYLNLNDLFCYLGLEESNTGGLYGWLLSSGWWMQVEPLFQTEIKADGFRGAREPVMVIRPIEAPTKNYKERLL